MKICIDPGHGMGNRQSGIYDPGATHVENGYRYEEATLALRYALTLRDVLRARGVEVFMTRDDDTDVAPVVRRAGMAAAEGCEALLSLHLNDAESDQANGCETLYAGPNAALAQWLQDNLRAATGLRDRGIKPRPELAVLKFAGPAALVELGFIGNDGDRARLLDAQVRTAVARALADALVGHLAGEQG